MNDVIILLNQSNTMHRPIAELLANGGIIVYTTPRTSVAEAAKKMAHHNVGSLLVLENGRKLVGIFTERDLLKRVVVPQLDPDETFIKDVMTTEVIVVNSATPCGDVMKLMEQHHCRHIPVADEDRLLGVISLRDLLRHDNLEKHFEIEQLKDYVLSKPYPVYPG